MIPFFHWELLKELPNLSLSKCYGLISTTLISNNYLTATRRALFVHILLPVLETAHAQDHFLLYGRTPIVGSMHRPILTWLLALQVLLHRFQCSFY